MNTRVLQEAIEQIIAGFSEIKHPELQEPIRKVNDGFSKMKKVFEETTGQLTAQANEDDTDDFEKLKKALLSERWPEAVNKNWICNPNSNTDKTERGRGVIEKLIDQSLTNKKFLDFGCGEGHSVASAVEKQAAIAVGYDLVAQNWDQWKTIPAITLTTDIQEAAKHGPYDVILLFDVIDHIKGTDPTSLLKQARELLADDGKIYIRFHPYTSKHATHLYHDLNKAYVHLVFTDEELKKIIPQSKYEEPNIGVVYPLITYSKYIKDADLKIVLKKEETDAVEPFFKIPKIAKRIMERTKTREFPEFQLSLNFIDMVVSK